MLQASRAALDLIKLFEGLSLKVYLCPANVWTIGYGHTGADVTADTPRITAQRADDLLRADVVRFEKAVNANVRVSLLQNEFDALVSFVYNIGPGAFSKSTLLRLLNAGESRVVVADQFLRWNRAGGRVLSGLTRRRLMERTLFLSRPEI